MERGTPEATKKEFTRKELKGMTYPFGHSSVWSAKHIRGRWKTTNASRTGSVFCVGVTLNHNQLAHPASKRFTRTKRTKRTKQHHPSVATIGFVFAIDVTIGETGNIRRTNANCVESSNDDRFPLY